MNSITNDKSSQTAPTRRVFVDLWANETLLQKRRIVVEVPSDCDDEEIKELGGDTLDGIAVGLRIDACWETEDAESFEVLEDISIEEGVPEHLEADLVFVRNQDGFLVDVEPA